jgi:transposase
MDVDHDAIVAARLGGGSLTQVADMFHVSRASVVRWVREARQTSPALPTSIQPIYEYSEEVAA